MNFSVVICTHNRAGQLENALISLCTQNYPKNHFEILVVDNNSTDSTKSTILNLSKIYKGVKIRYLFEKKQGISFSSNHALKHVKFNQVVFFDDDEIAPPDLLNNYYQVWYKHKSPKLAIVGGQILPKYLPAETRIKHSQLKDAVDDWVLGIINPGKKTAFLKFPEVLYSGNFCINKNIILKEGGFNEKLSMKRKYSYIHGTDIDLCFRMYFRGYQILYSPQIKVWHIITPMRFNARFLIRRYFCSGIEMQYIERKFLGKEAGVNYLKYFIKIIIIDVVRLILLRKPKNKFLDYVYGTSYSLQTILSLIGVPFLKN